MKTPAFVACLALAAAGGALLGSTLLPTAPVAAPPVPIPAAPVAVVSDPPLEVPAHILAQMREHEATLAEIRSAAAPAAAGTSPPATPAPPPNAITREQMDGLLDSVKGQVLAGKERIRELEAEIARLKATLPEPEILRNLRAGRLDELVALATSLRAEMQGRLLTPPEALSVRFADFLRRPSSGTARILPRGKFSHVIEKREGGAYWSFFTKDNDYDKEPDLGLEGGKFKSGFYGNACGHFLELGATDPMLVGNTVQAPPPGLDERGTEAWVHLWADSPFSGSQSWRDTMKPLEAWRKKAGELKLENRVAAGPDRTYLLRSMLPDEHDILVLFHTAGEDETGMNLVWQVLEDWEIPRRR